MTPATEGPEDMPQEDRDLLEVLAATLSETEPIPERALQTAYAAHLMGRVEADLAELTYDSATESLAVRRGDTDHAPRFLSFTNEYLTLDVSLLADRQGLVGEIDPPLSEELVVEGRDGSRAIVPVDSFGRFRASCDLSSFRIVIDGLLSTQWITG